MRCPFAPIDERQPHQTIAAPFHVRLIHAVQKRVPASHHLPDFRTLRRNRSPARANKNTTGRNDEDRKPSEDFISSDHNLDPPKKKRKTRRPNYVADRSRGARRVSRKTAGRWQCDRHSVADDSWLLANRRTERKRRVAGITVARLGTGGIAASGVAGLRKKKGTQLLFRLPLLSGSAARTDGPFDNGKELRPLLRPPFTSFT